MGLDMYLYANQYLSQYRDDEHELAGKILDIMPDLKKFNKKSSSIGAISIEVTIGYWRKANHIHRWFLENCAKDEEDKCQKIYVTRENLEELRKVCDRVLQFKHLAEDQLPTTTGFFFGGTAYDEYYYSAVKDTVYIINNALELPDSYEIYYQASW